MELFHPIRLMAKPDGDLTTVIHSFFLFSFDANSQSADVICRHPRMRKNIDMVEEGLKGLITETLLYCDNKEVSVANVLTNHDGRLYVYASGTRQKIVAVVSSLPAIAFSRSLLRLLNDEPGESLLPIVYSLCELPILPVPNISYQFQFANSNASIKFSELEHVIDLDMDVVVLNMLSPIMIVKAWEALIVERRLVVASVNPALLLSVCEFLKKLIAPFPFVGTYIPVIPSSGIEALEAPGNFIIGVDSNALKASSVSLTGIVLLDLDRRSIIHTPTTADDPYYAAPSCLITYLHRAVTQVMDEPLSKWMNRSVMDIQICPYSPEAWSQRATNIIRVFAKTNLSILSAQYCTARAFFRSVSRCDNECFLHTLGFSFAKDPLALMGYSEHRSVHVGCMQLWKDPRIIEDAIHHTIPCWVEMDDCAFALYEQADDLPLLLIPIEEFEAVASSSMEPEGHVFEVTLKNQSFFRFTTSDSHCRKLWLHAIEKKMNAVSKGYQVVSTADALKMRVKSQYVPQSTNSNGVVPPVGNSNNNGMTTVSTEETESVFLPSMLGLSSFEASLAESSEIEHYHDFRHLIRKTQLSLTLYMVTECERFETLFTKRAESLYSFIYDNHSYDAQMKKYISTIFRTSDTLRAISLDVENNRDAILGRTHLSVNTDTTDVDSQLSPTKSTVSRSTAETDISSDGRSVEDESTKKKGLMQRWFSTSKPSKSAKVVEEEQQQMLLEAEREQQEKSQQIAIQRLAVVSAVYNRCLSALNVTVVDDRMKAMEKFMGPSNVELDKHSLTYNITEIIKPLLSSSNVDPISVSKKKAVGYRGSLLFNATDGPTYELFDRLYDSFIEQNLNKRQSTAMSTTPIRSSPSQSDLTITTDTEPQSSINSEDPAEDEFDTEFDISVLQINNATDDTAFEKLHDDVKDRILTHLQALLNASVAESPIVPVLETLAGYTLQNKCEYSRALKLYSNSNLVSQNRLAYCVLQLFVDRTKSITFEGDFSELIFIHEALQVNTVVGMHTYRLLLELVFTELQSKQLGGDKYMESPISLGSFRCFPRSGAMFNSRVGGRLNMPLKRSLRSGGGAEFDWIEAEARTEIVNEAYICSKLNVDINPCDLSAQLLIKLREVLKLYAKSPAGEKYCSRSNGNEFAMLRVTPQMLSEIQQLSSFKKFELESSQLQKIDINNLQINEKLLLFTNVYNMLVVHSSIIRGSPGQSILERTSFMRSSKYNIGGYVFSLIDIEHGVLRNASTKPMLLGPLSIDMSFSERDPRYKFALDRPKPNISFCLFLACVSSPPLCVLTDPKTVDKDMAYVARNFFLHTVKFDYSKKAIYLPALVKTYWADFGNNQSDVLKYIATTAGSQFAAKTKDYLSSIGKSSAKTHFTPFEWTPVFILTDV